MKEDARGIGFARYGQVKPGLQTLLSVYAQAKEKDWCCQVTDCQTGRLVSTNNRDELAAVITEWLTNEELHRKLGSSAHQTINDKFTRTGELDRNPAVDGRLALKV
jgi:hypothetical protein